MSAKSKRKAEIKAAKQAAYGKQSAWTKFQKDMAAGDHTIANKMRAAAFAEFKDAMHNLIHRRGVVIVRSK